MYAKVSERQLDKEALWFTFNEMQKVPQLARSLVERLVLNPELDLTTAKNQLLAEVFNGRAFANSWEICSILERLLLQEISKGNTSLFSIEVRNQLAKLLGIQSLAVSTVQSAIRTLRRKNLIGRFPERSGYFIEDPNFKEWLLQTKFFYGLLTFHKLLRTPSQQGRWPAAGWGIKNILQSQLLKERSRHLRKNMTIAEKNCGLIYAIRISITFDLEDKLF